MPLPIVNEQGQEFESVEAFNNLLIKGRDAQYLLTPHMFHGGVHLSDESVPWGRDRAPVRCIADGEVVAYRMMKQYLTSEYQGEQLRYSNSFCLVRHRYQETSPEGEKREFRYYSLYMHLCPQDEYPQANRYRLKQARRVRHSVPSADFQPPTLTLKAGEEFELVEGEARKRGTVTGQGEFEFARIKILTAGGSSAEVLATEGMDNLWLAMEDHAIEPAFTVKRPSWIYDQVEAVVTENMVGRADPLGRKGATGYPLAGDGSYSVAKGSLIQFSAHEVEWQEIGGKARQMARCRVVPMAKTVWLCVEAQNIEIKRQGTSTLDKLYALPNPVAIKGGDVIGYLGRYEGPETRFGGRNEEHLVHLEVFSDDPNVEAIVGSGRWQEAGYKLVKGDSHGALVGPATDFFGELYRACDLDKDGELSAEEIWAGLKTKRTADGLFKIVAEHNSEWWAPASQAMLDQFAAVEKEPEEALLRAHEQERVLKLSWMDKPEVRSLGFSGPKVWFFYPMAFEEHKSSSKKYRWAHSAFADLLGKVESKNDYTAYNRTKPKLASFYKTNLTSLTLGELMKKQMEREVFAAGRYQIIPTTLKESIKFLSLDVSLKFDEEIQDKIFDEYIIRVKRKGFIDYLEGSGSIEDAIYAWAMEFASAGVRKGKGISPKLVLDESGRPFKMKRVARFEGESYYSGDGLNVSHIMPDEMVRVLRESKGEL